MTGRFIAVVGPSGVGKDSVMQALGARDPRLSLVRRVITRPGDAGGEDFDGVTEAEFAARQAAGQFALSWPAHGLLYAVPASVDATLRDGHDVLVNLSRAVLLQAQARFTQFAVILLKADHAALRMRLRNRGRETEADIQRRLMRADFAMPNGLEAHVVDNSGPLDETIDAILTRLYPVRA
ncbi:MAG: ribose 1,5-bisphosphokinase [Paracoccaceae bacterium]